MSETGVKIVVLVGMLVMIGVCTVVGTQDSRAYYAGVQARQEGKGPESNPYGRGEGRGMHWAAGYVNGR